MAREYISSSAEAGETNLKGWASPRALAVLASCAILAVLTLSSCHYSRPVIVDPSWLFRSKEEVILALQGDEARDIYTARLGEKADGLTVIAGGPLPRDSADDYVVKVTIILDPGEGDPATLAPEKVTLGFEDREFELIMPTDTDRALWNGTYYDLEFKCESCGILWFDTTTSERQFQPSLYGPSQPFSGHSLLLDLSDGVRWNGEPIEFDVIELVDPRPWYRRPSP